MTNTHRDDLIQSYNNHAQKRETSPVLEWKFPERERILALFQQENAQTLLEIGAGTGRDSLFFREHDLQVICIDLSPTNVKLCQEKGLDAFKSDHRVSYDVFFSGWARRNRRERSRWFHIFPAQSFDAVYAMNSLLHLPKAEMPQVLEQIHKVLKPEGIFYLGVYGGIDQEGI